MFKQVSDFDQNGIFYWIGSNARYFCYCLVNNNYYLYCRTCDWINPASHDIVVVSSSDGHVLPYGNLEDILSRDENPVNCHTKDDRNSWFAIDTGIWFYPTSYSLKHSRGYGK